MACNCLKEQDFISTSRSKRPDEPCLVCAYKHFAHARTMAKEHGYEDDNRDFITGNLVNVEWHIWKIDYKCAEMARDIRHAVELFTEDSVSEEHWHMLSERIRSLLKTHIQSYIQKEGSLNIKLFDV